LLALMTATALLVGAAACSDPTNGGSAANGASGQDLSVYLYQKPKRFSPLDTFGGAEGQVMSLVFDNLLSVNSSYAYEPRLAQSWDVSPDSTTYTFHLRKGLKWSDGKPFSSQDVLFTYQLLANPAISDGMSGRLAAVAGVKEFTSGKAKTISGFTAPDSDTFVVKLAKPSRGFLSDISGGTYAFIVPQHVLGGVPVSKIKDDPFWNKPTVGMGPYTFVQYKTDQYVEVVRNPNFRTPASIQRIFLKTVSSDVATAQLGTGELRMAQISATDAKTVSGMSGIKTVSQKGGNGFVRIAVNQTEKRFQDPRVRQAMLYALDRKQFVEKSLAGHGLVPNSSLMGQFLPAGLNDYAYDPQKAKSLLAAAGWDSSKPVSLAWIPGTRDRDDMVTLVQSQLTAVGIKIQLKQVQAAELGDLHNKATFDLTLFGGGLYTVDGSSVYPILSCTAFAPKSGNIPRFCDQQLEGLMDRAGAEPDAAKRLALYQQVAQRDNQLVSYLWLYSPDTIWAYSDKLSGFTGHGNFTLVFWNVYDWKLAK
jgi:peptide/nickel transport system substrate-binding protein